MKTLAIEKEIKGINPEYDSELLRQESKRVWELMVQGIIREIYFNQKHNAVIIMECDTIQTAEKFLNSLPLVSKGLIAFELMTLLPYTGFERLF